MSSHLPERMAVTRRRRGAVIGFCTLLALVALSSQAAPGSGDTEVLQRTAEAHAQDAPVATPAATTVPVAEVVGKDVVYGRAGTSPLTGYVARPKHSSGPLPALIVIHEWWGLNDNIRAQTRRLAAEGYVALAVDLYGGKVADKVPDALKLAQALSADPEPGEQSIRAAWDYLAREYEPPAIGSIGWCMGGNWSLRTAVLYPDQLDAAVIYYGTLRFSDEQLAKLEVPILGLFASKDRVVPVSMVQGFESTMRRLGKDVDVHVYEGVDHAFSNPSGTAYDAEAAESAWALTRAFLDEHLRTPQN